MAISKVGLTRPNGSIASRSRNRLLATLAAMDDALSESVERVDLPVGTCVAEMDAIAPHAYFPETAVISLITIMTDGTEIEAATVGNEGFVGLALALSGKSHTDRRAVAQVPGYALRVPSGTLHVALRDEAVRARCLRYAAALFYQVTQTAACNRLHSMEQRCARWLLMTNDRAGSDTFFLTQQYLAVMLGVRRATVNAASGRLQRAGLIQSRRGHISVLDRAGLEARACECYRSIRRVYERELPWSTPTEVGVSATE